MLYRLSKLIPVPMRSRYGHVNETGGVTLYRERWWQWRGRIFRDRVQPG